MILAKQIVRIHNKFKKIITLVTSVLTSRFFRINAAEKLVLLWKTTVIEKAIFNPTSFG